MPNLNENYNILIRKLDQFIRKHYLNQLIRGVILSAALLLGIFLLLDILEYYFFFPTVTRKIMFYGFIIASAAILYKFIFLPLLHFSRLGKIISHEQAAEIIGTHFAEVKDKLLNILQLKKQSESQQVKDLIEASIDQKIEGIKPVPFTSAINLNLNRKHLRYLILPLLVFFIILFAAPNIIKDSSTRLFYNNIHFEKPAPFTFKVNNKDLKVVQFEDFLLDVSVSGDVIPDEVFIKQDGYSYKMNKRSSTHFSYNFVNLQNDVDFVLTAAGYDSKVYEIKILPKPMIVNFEVSLDYPAYTGKKDEILKNIGDITVPVGSKVRWDFSTKNTEDISVEFGKDEVVAADRKGEKLFSVTRTLMEGDYYKIKVSNDALKDADSISYSISVLPDQYPSINVQPLEDSVSKRFLYFLGEVSDDYGLSKLVLKYKLEGKRDYQVVPVSFDRGNTYSQFSHYWDLKAMDLKPGDALTYFFEVWDNDRINGSKSTRSTMLQFKVPSMEEIDKEVTQNNENIKQDLESTIKEAEDVKKNMKSLQDKLFQKKNMSWEDKKSIEDLLQKQKSLEENVQSLQKQFNDNLEKQKEFKDIDKNILEKQQKLQELFDQVLSDEMKQLFEELESLMDELDQEDILENLENFEFSDDQLEDELDRMLSLFKQLEFEQKLTETVDKLEELAKEQEELSKDTKNKTEDNEKLTERQNEINEKFENVKEDLKELEDIDKELGDKNSFSETEENAQKAQEQLDQSKQNLEQNKNKKASDSQKQASDKMKKMSDQLAQMMNTMQMQQMQMDMQVIRQLLENLITLSFDQEDLMETINATSINDPRYVRLVQQQYKIKDDTKMVKDSLYALSKRVFQLQSFINREVGEVTKNIGKSIDDLEERKKNNAAMHQQYVMTGFNNLALMLSEAMDAMQQQMASQMPGSQNCQKKGGKGMPTPKMSEMQKQLNEQLSELQKQVKKGEKPGGKGGMSKELAEMAAKQAALREALKKMNQEENGDGSLGDLQKMIDEMDKTETELVNKKLTEEMLKRQQDILTRLLDAEDAMRQRDQDKERESQTAEEMAKKIPPSIEEYLKNREAEIQLYKTVPPSLKPYYKQLIESYFKNISF